MYTWPVGIAVGFSVFSMLQMVIGTNNDGISGGWAIGAWIALVVSLICLAMISLLLAKTFDVADGRGGSRTRG